MNPHDPHYAIPVHRPVVMTISALEMKVLLLVFNVLRE